jgi:hypothetical protein
MAQRGNTDYDQIRSSGRQGFGTKFQMFGGGSTAAGHAAVFDASGNVVDGGSGFTSGVVLPTRTVSASTTLLTTDYCVVVTAVCTITLPAAPPTGQSYQIKNGMTAGSTVTVSGSIDGLSSITLAGLASVSLIYDGSVWRQI